jgi:hypothetical protein
MFGDMFEDEEDYSLSAFSATGGRGAGGRRALSRPAEPRPSDGFVGLLNQCAHQLFYLLFIIFNLFALQIKI